MKTLVINLKESADRRARMAGILAAFQSLDVEFVEAVNGNLMTPAEQERRFDTGGGTCATWGNSGRVKSVVR